MKYLFLLWSFTITLQASAVCTAASFEQQVVTEKRVKDDKVIRYDYLSAGSGILGIALIFLPYLSLIGLILGVAAVVFSWIAFRKKQKSRWSWIGLIAGGLTVVALLGVLGVIIFF